MGNRRREQGARGRNQEAAGKSPPGSPRPKGRGRSRSQDNGAISPSSGGEDYNVMDSIVKVFCTHTEPNFSLPWQKKRGVASTSSGFVISVTERKILTNAHSVEHHTQVKVKRRGSDEKHVARVLTIGTECDIAMLTVDDASFWVDLEKIEFGVLPMLQDDVTVIGYPVGGDTISVTSGVVSRIEVTSYLHGATDLLSLQIDAAINSGKENPLSPRLGSQALLTWLLTWLLLTLHSR